MRVVQINTVRYGSTGKIALSIKELCDKNNIQCQIASRYPEKSIEDSFFVSSWLDCHMHNRLSQYTMMQGCFSRFHTKRFLKKVEAYRPNIIHLHNLHGSYINLPLLFRYIKRQNVPVVWTLHDCWAMTGQCPHFTMVKCNNWKTGCHDCPFYRENPASLFDNSKKMYKLKKKWFTGVPNMTIVTPSQWLADLVKESYLKDYPIKVIHNGIDLEIFKPTPSNFRWKYGIADDKYIVLGVAFGWGKRKGLDAFIDLAKRLDHEKYLIVLVGTDDNVDKQLPDDIVSIHRTQNQTELAEIYTAADVFANPTREENYPTVNMESIACGTPVLTFRTGGSPEILDETCGSVVDCDDIDAMEREIVRICETNAYTQEAILKKAKEFDINDRFEEYIKLYRIGGGGVSLRDSTI